VYLRIELALIIAIACASIAISKLERTGPVSAVAEASPLALGGLLALLSIRASLGHFLPDTALAKSGHASLSPLFATMQVFGSAVLLGFGCVLAWASSWILSLRRILSYSHHRATSLLISVLENCPLFIIVALSCLRGQRIQGVRYVIWPLIFGIIANAVQIAREDLEYPVRFRLETVTKWMTIAFAVIFLCILPLDWRWAATAMRGRSETFLEMRSAHFDRAFADKTIIASDVGFITYFSGGRTCDLAGLVDGREMAAMKPQARIQFCAQQSPAMMFLTSGQAKDVEPYIDFNDWMACGIYDFTNVHSNDRHYLLVPKSEAESVCRSLERTPAPLSDYVPNAA
jgi:hypothetical protein